MTKLLLSEGGDGAVGTTGEYDGVGCFRVTVILCQEWHDRSGVVTFAETGRVVHFVRDGHDAIVFRSLLVEGCLRV